MADGGTQMIKYLTMTIGKQKNIALIAHDGKKQDIIYQKVSDVSCYGLCVKL